MKSGFDKYFFSGTLRKTLRQFASLLPILTGVVLIFGLMRACMTKNLLTSIFTGNPLSDTLRAAVAGSIAAGNPINSYIIGGELLEFGVSLFAATAFILTWVTVGIIQLPAEGAALGKKFALIRNGIGFIIAIPVSIITVIIFNLTV